jgi:hypothetical protein
MRRLQGWALSNRVGRERKPAPVKRPPDGPSVACPDWRRFTGRRMPCACVYIRPLPTTSGSHIEDLNCNLFYENPVLLLPLERLADVLRPRPSIPSFPAVETVTESVPRVGVIRSHLTTMPCDVSSNFLPSLHQAEVPVCGVLHHIVCLVRRSVPRRSYDGPVKKKPQVAFALICPYTSVTPSRRR